jgi:hypothetical protein
LVLFNGDKKQREISILLHEFLKLVQINFIFTDNVRILYMYTYKQNVKTRSYTLIIFYMPTFIDIGRYQCCHCIRKIKEPDKNANTNLLRTVNFPEDWASFDGEFPMFRLRISPGASGILTPLLGQLLDSPEFPNFQGKYISWIFIFLCKKTQCNIQKLEFQKLDCVHETWNYTNLQDNLFMVYS